MPGFQEAKDAIIASEMEPLVVDGKTYGFPVRGNSIHLIYNKQMFRDAGLDPENPPKTLEELADAAVALTKRDADGNVEVYGFEIGMTPDAHWTLHAFSPIFWGYGGEYQLEDGSSGFGTEAGVKALEYWDMLVNELQVSPVERITNGFVSGKLAMMLDGEWNFRHLAGRISRAGLWRGDHSHALGGRDAADSPGRPRVCHSHHGAPQG